MKWRGLFIGSLVATALAVSVFKEQSGIFGFALGAGLGFLGYCLGAIADRR